MEGGNILELYYEKRYELGFYLYIIYHIKKTFNRAMGIGIMQHCD